MHMNGQPMVRSTYSVAACAQWGRELDLLRRVRPMLDLLSGSRQAHLPGFDRSVPPNAMQATCLWLQLGMSTGRRSQAT